MTDTPRTRAELLTDFADNQNHGITAQKMRNFVVSNMGDHLGETSVFAVDASVTPVADNTSVAYKVHTGADPSQTHVYDPLGILETDDDYVSTFTGLTHEAGSWWSLDEGLWLIRSQIVWSTSSSAGTRVVEPGPIDNRQDTADLDHVFWNPGYHSGMGLGMETTRGAALVNANGFGGGYHSYSGIYRVLEDVAPVAFGCWLLQDSGGPLALTSGVIKIMRIA